MPYGTVEGVGALVSRYSGTDKDFADTTRPAAGEVTTWIAEISSMVDVALAQAGFEVPITDSDITPMLDAFVNRTVADMVEGSRGFGRFGPDREGARRNQSPFSMIMDDVARFVARMAAGMEAMGGSRDSEVSNVSFRQYDDEGEEVQPIFQRDAFGNRFIDYDK